MPSIRQTRPIGPAGDGVGDEQLLAVDDVVVAVEHGRGPQGRQVGAGAGLGQGEGREPLAAGQPRQEPLLLLGRAEGPQRVDGADAAVDRGQAGDRRRRCVAIRVRNRAKRANGAPCPPYSRSTSRPQ